MVSFRESLLLYPKNVIETKDEENVILGQGELQDFIVACQGPPWARPFWMQHAIDSLTHRLLTILQLWRC